MKLDFDMSAISRFFTRIGSEFRQKHLWPVAAVLLVALVAVPLLLSDSSSTPAAPQTPLPAVPPTSDTSLPTIDAQVTPAVSHLTGSARNPFASSASASTSTTSSTSSDATSTNSGSTTTSGVGSTVTGGSSTGASTGSTSASTGSGSSSTGSSGASGTTTPPSITGSSKPKPAPTGLSSTQSYDVSMAITNSTSGVDTFDPTRLGLIPSDQQPLLVELGVLQGGSHVLFAVQPGTVINGPGTCTPGPIDCEVLSLAQDQTESVSAHGSAATLFAITAITAVGHASTAASNKAREAASARGKAVFARDRFRLPALSLFKYEPSVGSVVDLRNLTVEG